MTTPIAERSCTIDDCNRPYHGQGFCSIHYGKWFRHGDPLAARAPRPKRYCEIDNCGKVHFSRNWCRSHYRRWQLWGDPRMSQKSRAEVGCIIEGCNNPHNAKNLCLTHYARKKNNGDPNITLNPGNYVDAAGYRYAKSDFSGRWIGEHRAIMERELSRPLLKSENVHHINGDRADNRLENLELWSKVQPAGQRVADKIEYAQEILALYAPHLLNKENINV